MTRLRGVLGRDDFIERLEEELGRSAMRGPACTLLMATIDDLEVLNLRRGGESDEALRTVTRALRQESRPGDTLGRISELELAETLLRYVE